MINCGGLYRDFHDAGFRVFGLYGADKRGHCECGNPRCQAVLKHPRISNWQHTPDWSEDQLEVMEESDQFATGYGIVCRDGLLVVDVDARNGGLESFAKLCELIPDISAAGLIVNTGSGNGSRHLFFKVPTGTAYLCHLADFKGIDFKTSGYVVGAGSLHKSGNRYTIGVGSVMDIDEAPQALIDLLSRPEVHRAEFNGSVVDITDSDIVDMLRYVPNTENTDYEIWIRVGMAIHHATGGTGYALWETWSAQSSKHDHSSMPMKWDSFGKSQNPVRLGTLVHYAQENGYSMPVTFTPTDLFNDKYGAHDDHGAVGGAVDAVNNGLPFNISSVDLKRPIGFVGDLAAWIESQSRRPRENISVAAALIAIGNIVGLKYTDDIDNVNTNLFIFCVAGSRTGKESIQQAITEVHRAAGIAQATHGAIKSEQEIVRNLTRHQAALYVIDEIGIFLQKVKSAQTKGGALYLDGVIGQLMAAYSKANGRMLLTGDLREELRASLYKEAAQIHKRLDDGATGLEVRLEQVEAAIMSLDAGLDRPFLSLIGFTTPITFDDLVDFQSATNGFIGRSLIFNERETAPKTKRDVNGRPRFTRSEMTEQMAMTLSQLYTAGTFDNMASSRVEYYGERTKIKTTPEARQMLDDALDWFEDTAHDQKGATGLEALYLGAYELVSKVSLILAVPEGVRNVEHVRWAFALVKRDVDEKTRLVTSNDRIKDAPQTAMSAKIMNIIGDDGETIGVIYNRMRSIKRSDIDAVIKKMVEDGMVNVIEKKHAQKGPISFILPAKLH